MKKNQKKLVPGCTQLLVLHSRNPGSEDPDTIKIWCFWHTDSAYKLEVGVQNDKYIVKYLSIIANTSWGPWDTAPETFSEAVSIML